MAPQPEEVELCGKLLAALRTAKRHGLHGSTPSCQRCSPRGGALTARSGHRAWPAKKKQARLAMGYALSMKKQGGGSDSRRNPGGIVVGTLGKPPRTVKPGSMPAICRGHATEASLTWVHPAVCWQHLAVQAQPSKISWEDQTRCSHDLLHLTPNSVFFDKLALARDSDSERLGVGRPKSRATLASTQLETLRCVASLIHIGRIIELQSLHVCRCTAFNAIATAVCRRATTAQAAQKRTTLSYHIIEACV